MNPEQFAQEFAAITGPQQPEPEEIDYSALDTIKLDNGKFVWTWTSPGGAAHHGPRHYSRRADAFKAGQRWLEAGGVK